MCCPRSDLGEIIASLLMGNEEEVGQGIQLVDDNYRDAICGWMEGCFHSLSREDILDAWQETLLGLFLMVKKGRFRISGSLFSLVWTIMRKRTINILNANTSRQRGLERYRSHVKEAGGLVNVEPWVRDEVFHVICEAIESLPPVQKTVWEAYRECGFAVRNLKELVETVEGMTGERPSDDSVRRGRQEGRKKVREYLRKRGYDCECNREDSDDTGE